MIPHEYIEELTRRTDIVELVGSYVQLKRKGRLYGGLCPFHSEKTPSFYVYPDTQSFYCFGCQAAGDAISFVRKINSIDYPEAVKLLAARAGMPEPQEDDKTGRMRSRILSMNKEAARFFHACLNSTVEEARQARAYWRRRGLDDKTIARFGLGYAPDDGQALYLYLRDKGYNQQELDASGLFKRSQSGRIYCLFWKRVMTPIFDLRGNIIAFGGRVLDDSKPKYVNSPETLVYHKSDTVFALQIAKKSASRRFVLCEGYMDVISMHQCGIENVVANSGTALSIYQIRLLHRFTNNIVLLYDGDKAGVHAALRGTDMLLEEEMNVKVLFLPDGNDPDSFARNHTAEQFRQYIADHQTDFIQFKTDVMLKGVTDPVKRSEAINSIVESISKIKNQITRAAYITDCSHRLGVNEAVIINALNSFIRNGMSEQVKEERRAAGLRDAGYPVKQQALRQAAVTPLDKLMEVEDLLIKLVIHHGDEIIKVQDADGNDVELPAAQYIYLDMEGDDFKFHHSIYNQIMAEAMEHIEEEGFRCETYFAAHPNPEISRIAGIPTGEQEITTASLQMKMNEEKLRQQIFKDMLSFRTHYIAQRIVEVQQEFKQNPGNRELLEEFVKLKKMNMLVASQSNNVFN